MNAGTSSYLSKRLLKLQVGFLLTEGPGNSRDFPIELPQRIKVDRELFLESLSGALTMTRTKEGILAQGTLGIRHRRACDRCLDEFTHAFCLPVAELFASPADPGLSAFSVDSNGEIDLAELLREEVLIEESYRVVCRDQCRGLSAESGVNLNHESEVDSVASKDTGSSAALDPRLAVLKRLLDE